MEFTILTRVATFGGAVKLARQEPATNQKLLIFHQNLWYTLVI